MSYLDAFPWVPRHRLTVEQYYRMAEVAIFGPEERLELIDGQILFVRPITTLHAAMNTRLMTEFVNTLAGRALVSVRNPIRLDGYSEPQPDIALLRPRKDFCSRRHPDPDDVLLLIEVADDELEYERTNDQAAALRAPSHPGSLDRQPD